MSFVCESEILAIALYDVNLFRPMYSRESDSDLLARFEDDE